MSRHETSFFLARGRGQPSWLPGRGRFAGRCGLPDRVVWPGAAVCLTGSFGRALPLRRAISPVNGQNRFDENSGQCFFLASGICVPLRTRDCINPGAEVLKTEFCRSAGDFAPCLLARDGEIARAFFFKP